MAAMWAKGELEIGEDFVHESIVGTTFTGRLHGETTVGGEPAVVPTIAGQVRARDPGRLIDLCSSLRLCVCASVSTGLRAVQEPRPLQSVFLSRLPWSVWKFSCRV